MVLASLFWSGAFIAGKYSVPYIPVFTLSFLRFFFAAIVLFVVMKVSHHPYRLQKAHIPVLLLTGTVGIFGYHVLFFLCLSYTTAINSAIIGAMNPIVTVILAYFVLNNKLKPLQVFGVILSFLGVFLTITGANIDILRGLDINKGDLIMLAAVVCWSIYSIISSRSTQADPTSPVYIPPIAVTFYSFLVGLIVLTPFAILEKPQTFLPNLPAAVWLAVLYMSIFPSVIGYLVQQLSIREIGPSRTSIFINLVPMFSIILAVVLLKEELEPVKLLTASLIILGVIITQRGKR